MVNKARRSGRPCDDRGSFKSAPASRGPFRLCCFHARSGRAGAWLKLSSGYDGTWFKLNASQYAVAQSRTGLSMMCIGKIGWKRCLAHSRFGSSGTGDGRYPFACLLPLRLRHPHPLTLPHAGACFSVCPEKASCLYGILPRTSRELEGSERLHLEVPCEPYAVGSLHLAGRASRARRTR